MDGTLDGEILRYGQSFYISTMPDEGGNVSTINPICSYSFTILGLWVLGLTVSHIIESQLQTYESRTLFLMTSLQYYCILGLAEIKTLLPRDYAQKMQDAQVTKSLYMH